MSINRQFCVIKLKELSIMSVSFVCVLAFSGKVNNNVNKRYAALIKT